MESAHKAVLEGLVEVVSELIVSCKSAEFSDVLCDTFHRFLSMSVEIVSLGYEQRLRLEVVLQHIS